MLLQYNVNIYIMKVVRYLSGPFVNLVVLTKNLLKALSLYPSKHFLDIFLMKPYTYIQVCVYKNE